jgi:hypothetical protein
MGKRQRLYNLPENQMMHGRPLMVSEIISYLEHRRRHLSNRSRGENAKQAEKIGFTIREFTRLIKWIEDKDYADKNDEKKL